MLTIYEFKPMSTLVKSVELYTRMHHPHQPRV